MGSPDTHRHGDIHYEIQVWRGYALKVSSLSNYDLDGLGGRGLGLQPLEFTTTPTKGKHCNEPQVLIANPLGFGTAPLGNMFRNVPEDEVQATVDAAWNNGVRYFDTAPFYGAGLSKAAWAMPGRSPS